MGLFSSSPAVQLLISTLITVSTARELIPSSSASGGDCEREDFCPRSLDRFLRSARSNCSSALRTEDLPSVPPSTTPLNESFPHSLRLLNVGSGSTGTSFLFSTACEDLKLRGVHWSKSCGYGLHGSTTTLTELPQWWFNITHCSNIPSERSPLSRRSERCRSAYLLRRLYECARYVFRRTDVLMDTPSSAIYAEFAPLFRDTLVILSIRPPGDWLRRRINRHHERIVMCKEHLLGRVGVRHPFDLPGCMRHTEYATEAIEHVRDADRVINGYRRMNAYNAAVTNKLHVMCLWDSLTSGERARDELVLLWRYFNFS